MCGNRENYSVVFSARYMVTAWGSYCVSAGMKSPDTVQRAFLYWTVPSVFHLYLHVNLRRIGFVWCGVLSGENQWIVSLRSRVSSLS